jgi:hypothetical protein
VPLRQICRAGPEKAGQRVDPPFWLESFQGLDRRNFILGQHQLHGGNNLHASRHSPCRILQSLQPSCRICTVQTALPVSPRTAIRSLAL